MTEAEKKFLDDYYDAKEKLMRCKICDAGRRTNYDKEFAELAMKSVDDFMKRSFTDEEERALHKDAMSV